jgi:FAD/FMN-containing dehydrogenase
MELAMERSPRVPADIVHAGRDLSKQVDRRARFASSHVDPPAARGAARGSYSAKTPATMGERSLTNVNQVLFDRDNADMMRRVDAFFHELVRDAKAHGYGEYRTHIEYMDLVASTYDFGGGALRKLNERVKDALDPNGIIAPGKSGIWPANRRGNRA